MSYNRNIKWLDNRRVIYRCEPVSDIPTIETNQYMFYENGTYQHYHLFNSRAKITTYKSLKWHMLVLYYLNIDGIEGDEISLEDDMRSVFKFIANKENGFVTFFIKQKILHEMIEDVFNQGGDPPKNKLRKVIFKIHSGLNLSEKLKIVGKLIGRSKLDKEQIYECMLDLNHMGKKITVSRIAGLLDCSARTIYRHMCNDLKHEKYILNEEV
jgi:hypothetical protein|tara:strand:- start:200 stop:835 length:636 start_codon:yes stop_codon:yes gene_type:complete